MESIHQIGQGLEFWTRHVLDTKWRAVYPPTIKSTPSHYNTMWHYISMYLPLNLDLILANSLLILLISASLLLPEKSTVFTFMNYWNNSKCHNKYIHILRTNTRNSRFPTYPEFLVPTLKLVSEFSKKHC